MLLQPSLLLFNFFSSLSKYILIFSYIDAHIDDYVKKLGDWVAIKSVSAWAETRQDVFRMVQHVAKV